MNVASLLREKEVKGRPMNVASLESGSRRGSDERSIALEREVEDRPMSVASLESEEQKVDQ